MRTEGECFSDADLYIIRNGVKTTEDIYQAI